MPSESVHYYAPMTLGNGMVHDSRYRRGQQSHSRCITEASLFVEDIDWLDFVGDHEALLSVGFRPSQLEGEVNIVREPSCSGFRIDVANRSVYVSDDDANYRHEIVTYLSENVETEKMRIAGLTAGSRRPVSIDTFVDADTDVFGVSVVWVYDDDGDAPAWKAFAGLSAAELDQQLQALVQNGDYRVLSLASRRNGNSSEYAVIFVDDESPVTDWDYSIALDGQSLEMKLQAKWDAGYYPYRGNVEAGSAATPRCNVLWTKRPPQFSIQPRYGMTEATFVTEDRAMRQAGYHLETATPYADEGELRYAAAWVRLKPYERWVGTTFAPGDTMYDNRYGPLHEQALRQMNRWMTPSQDQYFRPSATLHIFEGEQLVFNRAYTYAPATYGDIKLDAPMLLASVSKSITAVAVLRQMSLEGISLTDKFVPSAQISGAPPAMSDVSMLSVFQMRGGFTNDDFGAPESYSDQQMIANAGYGGIPIDGEEMFAYATDPNNSNGNRLGANDSDAYWDQQSYLQTSLANSTFLYSNVGYTMLGEVVRIYSGVAYEDYVENFVFAPLGVGGSFYPDPGHRNASALEPPVSGVRSYLLNTDHPYSPTSFDPVEPLDNLDPTPAPQLAPTSSEYTDNSPRWANSVGPVDPTTPDYASVNRYAGKNYLGGAPLGAGGWHGDGRALGQLIRDINVDSSPVLPQADADLLWSPLFWDINQDRVSGWVYGLGWYARGNWVAMAGGTDGSMGLALYNRQYDFTVVFLSNVIGNALATFVNPLLMPDPVGQWSTANTALSILGGEFPCADDLATAGNECMTLSPAIPY